MYNNKYELCLVPNDKNMCILNEYRLVCHIAMSDKTRHRFDF
jgi:hypothetical protein